MPEKNDVEVEKNDLQLVLDAVNKLAEMVAKEPEEDKVVEDPVEEISESLTKDDVRSMIQAALAEFKVEPEKVEPDPEPVKVTYYYKAPAEEDFEDSEEYTKALDAYNALVDSIKEDIEKAEETIVSKSVDVDPKDGESTPDFAKIWDAAGTGTFTDLIHKVGAE
jgi:ribonuclease D